MKVTETRDLEGWREARIWKTLVLGEVVAFIRRTLIRDGRSTRPAAKALALCAIQDYAVVDRVGPRRVLRGADRSCQATRLDAASRRSARSEMGPIQHSPSSATTQKATAPREPRECGRERGCGLGGRREDVVDDGDLRRVIPFLAKKPSRRAAVIRRAGPGLIAKNWCNRVDRRRRSRDRGNEGEVGRERRGRRRRRRADGCSLRRDRRTVPRRPMASNSSRG